MDFVQGMDVNHNRAGVPLKPFKQNGGRFVLAKCSEWETLDVTYLDYQKESASYYLPFGGFLYWRVDYDPLSQARFYCENLGKVQFPPIVDFEKPFNVQADGKTPLKPPTENVKHLKIVVSEILKITNKPKIMLYTSYNAWEVLAANDPFIKEVILWVANWGRNTPLLPVGATEWCVWQDTNTFTVEGYPKNLDGDKFNGNEAAFEAQIAVWNNGGTTPPPPPEEHTHPELQKDIDRLTTENIAMSNAIVALSKRHDGDIAQLARMVEDLQGKMTGVGKAALGE